AGGLAGEETNWKLPNGLTVVLRPIPTATKVCLLTLFHLGGDADPAGQSGLAHLIEHCYVTAAAGSTQARTVDAYVRQYPDGWNAQTGEDYTVIATVFPPDSLASELKDAAARLGDLHIAESDLTREKPRLLAEVGNMFGGMPSFAAWNLARERVRPTPEQGRRGGVPDQVTALTLPTVQKRWEQYYKPVNATLVLTGSFDPKAARAAIQSNFRGIAAGIPAPSAVKRAPALTGTMEQIHVTAIVPMPVSEVCLMAAAPRSSDPEFPAFLVLLARLMRHAGEIGGGDPTTGRFPPPVFYSGPTDPAVFSVSAPVQGKESALSTVDRLKAFLAHTVQPDLQSDESSATIQQIGILFGLGGLPDSMWAQNPYFLAFSLARQMQLGVDAPKLTRALNALTAEDLRRCARRVFAPSGWATVVVVPK
ncbi:MAG: putative Zn-dependent peptidase, partial [Chthonomonadales bacterium]|nr:putative Zn-dependent peptidase [Chthonomonadales bacterium]